VWAEGDGQGRGSAIVLLPHHGDNREGDAPWSWSTIPALYGSTECRPPGVLVAPGVLLERAEGDG
jgi:hypothetical protein